MAEAKSSMAGTMKLFATKGTPVGTACTNKDLKKWCEDGEVLGKNNTSQNMDICFSKCKVKGQNNVALAEVDKICNEMAAMYMKDRKSESLDAAKAEIKEKMKAAVPKSHGTTKQSKTGNVGGMTDASKYTGAHKSRFDADGKGKGIEGRKDVADNSGYVGNYKGEGTYEGKK